MNNLFSFGEVIVASSNPPGIIPTDFPSDNNFLKFLGSAPYIPYNFNNNPEIGNNNAIFDPSKIKFS